jgi:hypothetical protein
VEGVHFSRVGRRVVFSLRAMREWVNGSAVGTMPVVTRRRRGRPA